MYDEYNSTQNEFDTVVESLQGERTGVPSTAVDDDSDIPEKLRGKSPKELARMYAEAEKLIGRQAQEVGEVRRLADELILSRMQPQQPAQAAPSDEIDDVDFFANPKESIAKAVANHPAVRQALAATQSYGKQEAKRTVFEKHPDALDITTSEDFHKFVSATPVRRKLWEAADRSFNVEAADELLTTFKELHGVHKKEERDEQQQHFKDVNKQALRDASVSVGGVGSTGKKTYRRADLIELQMRDPNRYEDLQPEIMAAYREGRVK